jgi:hypothetical protein
MHGPGVEQSSDLFAPGGAPHAALADVPRALLLVSAVSVPAAHAASTEGSASAIVSGVLADATENPVAGSVELFAWPTGRPVGVGESLQLLSVGHDRAARDGRFSVTGDLTPELAELARLNGGYINFVLQATAAGVIDENHFSRYVGDTPFTAQDARPARRPTEWRASPEEPAVPVMVRLQDSEDASANRISPMQGGCWGNRLVERQVAHTIIGELRTPEDTVEAFFAYGKRPDSEIGVAGRASGGSCSGAGSFHIANADDTRVSQRAGSGKHLLVRTRFMYERYEYSCPSGKREKVVPSEWMGDVQAEPTTVRGCAGVPETRLGRFTPETDFTRNKEKAIRWEGAVDIFGASLSARSGYSQWVEGYWKFGAADMHVLCGDNGPPKRAGHIFAGTSA